MNNEQSSKKQQLKNSSKILVRQQSMVSSPLPPPEWLERFSKVYPDAAKEIFEDFKKVSETNRIISLKLTENEVRKVDLQSKELTVIAISQWHGFIATVIVLFSALFCAYIGQKEIALGFLGISLAGIIRALIRKNND